MDLSEYRYLVSSEWLAEHLQVPDLRVVECTSQLPNYFEPSASEGLKLESGRSLWEEGHIPGSTYVDILADLSAQHGGRYMYGIPSAAQFSRVMSQIGVGNSNAVVLYDRRLNMWAARMWWMLRTFGFDNAVVLDGGWPQWLAEGRPVSTAAPQYPHAAFRASYRPELIAARERVEVAVRERRSCLINALDEDEFAGRPPQRYARAGRIPSSVNVPFMVTVNPDTQLFADDAALEKIYTDVGVNDKHEIICYCGGGIAACNTALTLTRLGYDNVAVYDGSMTEWAADPTLPMESG